MELRMLILDFGKMHIIVFKKSRMPKFKKKNGGGPNPFREPPKKILVIAEGE